MAGINAEKEPVVLDLDLDFLGSGDAVIYSDGDSETLLKENVSLKKDKKKGVKYSITLPSERGFVIVK